MRLIKNSIANKTKFIEIMKHKTIYYHIHKIKEGKSEWVPGDEYFINPNESNNFQKNLISGLGNIRMNTFNEPIGLIKHVSELLKGNVNNDKLNCACDDLTRSFKQYIKWIQEEIFEKVRLSNYPNLPSRKSCLWICTYDHLIIWMDIIVNNLPRFYRPNVKILSLFVEGKCHEADGLFIDADTYKIKDFESAAHNYWCGKHKAGNEIEVLFQGKVTVLEEFRSINEINRTTTKN